MSVGMVLESFSVNDLVRDFLLSGMPISEQEVNTQVVRELKDSISAIISDHIHIIRSAARKYKVSKDFDALLLALAPIHNKILYEAYSPYWLFHCRPVTDHDSETEFTYYNDLIDMYWAWEWQEWKKRDAFEVTIMLPPTRGLISLAYRESS